MLDRLDATPRQRQEERRARLVAEELYLIARNVEFSIEHYLLENGVSLDTQTRKFLANTRDAMTSIVSRTESKLKE